MMRSVLFVADVKGWAFDNICANIAPALSPDHQVHTIYMADYQDQPARLIRDHFIDRRYDIVHFFWREDLRAITWPGHVREAARLARCDMDGVIEALCAPIVTTSVYDHLFSDPAALTERIDCFCFAHGFSVSSSKLHTIYTNAATLPDADLIIPDGVDADFYAAPGRVTPVSRKALVVGWVGNSRWGDHSLPDAKGFHTILTPAIDIAHAGGAQIVGHFADVVAGRRSRAQMPQYYREIDVLVCSSLYEGTPNPVLEAMAAGVAIISTDVGIVRQCLGPLQQDFILERRCPRELAGKLELLARSPALLRHLQDENLVSIRGWGWATRADDWCRLWEVAGQRQADPRLRGYRRQALRQACASVADATVGRTLMMRARSRLARSMYRYPRMAATVNWLRGRK